MDTLLEKCHFTVSLRTCECVLTMMFFVSLVLTHTIFIPPLYANDLIVSNSFATPALNNMKENLKEEINPEILKNKFDERIKEKYQGYNITDISNGIKHVKMTKYFNGRPVKINIVEINNKVAKDYEIKPATASNITLSSRRTLRTIAENTNSIVAINGGFFKPQTGVPLGTLMIDKKIYTGPIYNRVALGIFENKYEVERIQLDAKIIGNNQEIKIDNINQPRILSSYVIAYSRDWGKQAPSSPKYGVQLQIVGNKITAA